MTKLLTSVRRLKRHTVSTESMCINTGGIHALQCPILNCYHFIGMFQSSSYFLGSCK